MPRLSVATTAASACCSRLLPSASSVSSPSWRTDRSSSELTPSWAFCAIRSAARQIATPKAVTVYSSWAFLSI